MKKIFYCISAFKPSVSVKHPHTTWLHFNSTEVSNIYETPVTPPQILGKSLTHAFTVASAYAKQLHGVRTLDILFLCIISFNYAILYYVIVKPKYAIMLYI